MHEQTAPASADWQSLSSPVHSWQLSGHMKLLRANMSKARGMVLAPSDRGFSFSPFEPSYWLLRPVGWLLILCVGFGLLKLAVFKAEEGFFPLYLSLISYKVQEASKRRRIRMQLETEAYCWGNMQLDPARSKLMNLLIDPVLCQILEKRAVASISHRCIAGNPVIYLDFDVEFVSPAPCRQVSMAPNKPELE